MPSLTELNLADIRHRTHHAAKTRHGGTSSIILQQWEVELLLNELDKQGETIANFEREIEELKVELEDAKLALDKLECVLVNTVPFKRR